MTRLFLRLLLIIMVFTASHGALAAELSPAAKFVDQLGQKAISLLGDQKITRSQREIQFATLLKANFDVPTLAHFALGRHWRDASEAEQKEYLQLFEDMVVKVYNRRFDDYAGQQFSTLGSSPLETNGPKDELVKTSIAQPDGPPITVEWRVRQKEKGYKIIDVIVEGVSMSVTQRSDFDAVLQSNGGQISGLLNEIKQRIANNTVTASPKSQ